MANINPHYNDCYFSEEGGLEESRWVFIAGNNIERFGPDDDICVGETGFGTGLNFLVLADYINRNIAGYKGTVDYFSCEKYPLSPEQVNELLFPFFSEDKGMLEEYLDFYSGFYQSLTPGINRSDFSLFSVKIRLSYFYGDVHEGLSFTGKKRDVWFLDGHDPEKNPDMWSSSVFALIGRNSMSGATLSSYTSKGTVKQGLRDAGFFIKRRKGYGRKRHMIQGKYLL